MAYSYTKIFGERNTNTNYLRRLVRANFRVTDLRGKTIWPFLKIQELFPDDECLRNWFFRKTSNRNLGWKHKLVDAAQLGQTDLVRTKQVAILTVAKNPYSWLLSMHRRPYHQIYGGVRPSFDKFLTTPWQVVEREDCSIEIANPVALWNHKNLAYLELQDTCRSLHLSAEELLEQTENVVARISTHFGLKRRSQTFVDIEESTKDKSKDKSYYRDYYLNERWKAKLTGDQISFINKHLDPGLMNRLGYALLASGDLCTSVT